MLIGRPMKFIGSPLGHLVEDRATNAVLGGEGRGFDVHLRHGLEGIGVGVRALRKGDGRTVGKEV